MMKGGYLQIVDARNGATVWVLNRVDGWMLGGGYARLGVVRKWEDKVYYHRIGDRQGTPQPTDSILSTCGNHLLHTYPHKLSILTLHPPHLEHI
jgi:hypothetical protein